MIIVLDSLLDDIALNETARLAETAPAGCFVEVGVYRGGCAARLAEVARKSGAELHLFDTFAGLPFQGPDDAIRRGTFGDVDLDKLRMALPAAHFHVGVFPETMPEGLPPVAFVHCDCDQVESVRAVLDVLWPRVVPDGLIVFDDMDQLGASKIIRERFGTALEMSNGRWFVRKVA